MIESFGHLLSMADSGVLVCVAMIGQVSGFLLKNQIMLRLLVLLGSLFYIWYYHAHPSGPLWDAIWASSAIIAANLIGLCRVLYAHALIGMTSDQRMIYDMMAGLSAGDFRRLMKKGEICFTQKDEILTEEGVHPDHLFFVISGTPVAEKCGQKFTIPPAHFIGEISLVLDCKASATVWLPAGGRYVKWDREKLSDALSANTGFERSFSALLSRDMACKVHKQHSIENSATNLTFVT